MLYVPGSDDTIAVDATAVGELPPPVTFRRLPPDALPPAEPATKYGTLLAAPAAPPDPPFAVTSEPNEEFPPLPPLLDTAPAVPAAPTVTVTPLYPLVI